MHPLLRRALAALPFTFPILAAAQDGALPIPLDKPLNRLTFTTAHNAFAHVAPVIRNQDKDIRIQLKDGVRALMLDLREHRGRVYLCHQECTHPINAGIRTLADVLNTDIMPHLQDNPEAIVTLFLEDHASPAKIQAELSLVAGLAGMTFDPSQWPDSLEWPTIRQLANKGQRLLIFTDKESNASDYSIPGGKASLMFGQDGTVENYWSLGDTIGQHDWSCRTRWANIPLNERRVHFAGKLWPPLFVMNQFHGQGETLHARSDNNLSNLWMRVEDQCRPASGKVPNFIAVDFYHQGDALEYAAALNHGGIVLWEGNNATQDAVCAIPYTGEPLRFSFSDRNAPIKGCENDEARSATLLNLKAGSRFTLFDSPSGSRNDDWTTVLVKRDIRRIDIGSFEKNIDSADVRVTHHGNNGLDGKVSFASLAVEEPGFVVFHEGNDATQNIVCTVPMPASGSASVNFGSNSHGCDNDEARSAKLVNVKPGSSITVYDSPSGSTGDDYTTITVHRHAAQIVIPHFETNTSTVPSVYTIRHYRKNGLNGKVSRAVFQSP